MLSRIGARMRSQHVGISVLTALLVIGCSSAPSRFLTRTSTEEVYESTTLVINRNPADEHLVFVHLPVPGAAVYQQAVLYFETLAGKRDSLPMQIESSGAGGTTTSMIGRCHLPSGFAPASLRIGLEQGARFIVYPAEIINDGEPPLRLTPFIRRSAPTNRSAPGTDDYIPTMTMIGVDAMRMRKVDGEYLPSSEDLRVVIRQSFKTVWQSNSGMSFLTVVMPVKPELPGEHSIYTLEWNGTDDGGMPLPPGDYTADIIIPAKPAPYHTQISFTWPLSTK